MAIARRSAEPAPCLRDPHESSCRVLSWERGRLAGDGLWPADTILEAKGVRMLRFTRITVDPRQMGGVPCIRGLRMPVATVVGMVADGMSIDDILREHPTLEAEDVREALRYAAEAVRERMIPLDA